MSSRLFAPVQSGSPRRHAPATERNRDAIVEVLARLFPVPGVVLELASGTGQHVAYFAARLPHLTFQPSDVEDELLASIDAWVADARVGNVRPAVKLDVSRDAFPPGALAGVLCSNLIHIAPEAVLHAVLRRSGEHLSPGGLLVFYGPFREGGLHTGEGNERFDADLRARNPEWGIRNLDDVVALAGSCGLVHEETVQMPANNRMVVLRKR